MIEFKLFPQLQGRPSWSSPTIFLASFLILSVGFTFLLLFFSSGNVFGHAFVLESNPAPSESLENPPTRVEVFLSEPVDDSYSEVKVIGPDGKQIDNQDTQHFDGDQSTLGVTLPKSGLEDGVYTVSTKMLSQIDGHVTDDAFVFGIGEKTSIPSSTSGQAEQGAAAGSALDQLSTPDAIARFPALVGQVVVVGAAFCALWLWRPFAKIALFKGTSSTVGQEYGKHGKQRRTLVRSVPDAVSEFRKSIDHRVLWIMLVGSAIVVVADFGMIYALAYSLDIGMVDAMTTKFGSIWFVRTSVSILLFALILFVYLKVNHRTRMFFKNRNPPPESGSTNPLAGASAGLLSKRNLIAILIVGVLTLLTTSLMGHGAATPSGTQIPITIDFVHNLAASIWIGGVIYLALAVVPRLKHSKTLNDRIKCGVLSIMIPRFTTLPVVALGVIVITGPFLLYLLEDDLNLTLASLYGKALLAKLIFAAIMLAIGGYNQRIVHRNALSLLTRLQSQEEQQVVVSRSKDARISQSSASSPSPSYSSSDFPPSDKGDFGLGDKLSLLVENVRQKIRLGRNSMTEGQLNIDEDKNENENENDGNDDFANLGKDQNQMNAERNTDSRPKRNPSKTWSRTISSFSRSIRTEAIFGILLLAAVAVLTNTGLPASEFQGQIQQAGKDASQTDIQNLLITTSGANNGIGDQGSGGSVYSDTQYLENATARIKLDIEPFAVGNNNFEVEFQDMSGNPIGMQTVGMKLTQTEENIGPIEIQTNKVSEGMFTANASFGLAGEWDLIVEGVRNKANALNLVATFNLFVKPDLDQIDYSVNQMALPGNRSQPLYPVYDSYRNSIWVGDTSLSSGRIFEYDIVSKKYLEHKIPGANIVTTMALDQSNGRIWFIDPISKALGVYDPQANSSKLYKFPNDSVVPSSIAFRSAEFPTLNNNNDSFSTLNTLNTGAATADASAIGDSSATVWITSPSTSEVLIFDTGLENFTNMIPLPTPNSNPLGIAIDSSNGQLWIAEGVGKIAHIDPANNLTVNEFTPEVSASGADGGSDGGAENDTLISPTALLIDPNTGSIYISEHDGHVISVFNTVFRTFSDFPPIAEDALPFGMALDKDRNLWVAEHVTNRLTVIDPTTGKNKEVTLPSSAPFVQYLTTDNEGMIWFAAQRGNSIGYITSGVNLLQGASTSTSAPSTPLSGGQSPKTIPGGQTLFTPLFNIGYEYLLGPIIAIGVLASAAFYINSVVSLKTSIRQVNSITTSASSGSGLTDRSKNRPS